MKQVEVEVKSNFYLFRKAFKNTAFHNCHFYQVNWFPKTRKFLGFLTSDGDTFVYSLHRYRYIISNDRYKWTPSVICL
jgi:hypothetical protein